MRGPSLARVSHGKSASGGRAHARVFCVGMVTGHRGQTNSRVDGVDKR
jgi:hypothetical protein